MIRKTSLFLLGLAFVSSAFAGEEYTRTFDKTIPLRAGQKVYLEHKLGDITIRTHSRPEVAIHALIKVSASDANEAKTFADRVDILVDAGATELSIRTRYPDRSDMYRRVRNLSYFVRYELSIPETAPLQVRNSFGGVSVGGLKANSEITTSHGALEFRDGRGTQRLENSFANVTVANNTGDVTVETSNGAVQADGIKGALSVRDRFANVSAGRVSSGVAITNSNGTVQVMDSGGIGTIRNSFGSVVVHGFKGDLTVDNTNGKVEALNVEGVAQLNTTFGEVQFSDVARPLAIRANNSKIYGQKVGGSITVENSFGPVTISDVQGGATVRSGNGAVTVTNIRGEANVRTSFGSVQANDIGGVLAVENNNGAVHAANVKGARVSTSFAGVVLDGVSGPLQVTNQNGSVIATSTLRGSCQPILIRTSFSPLQIRLPGDASYHVMARTSFGKIRTDFPLSIQGSISNDNLNGTIGSGRCEMTLTNTNGSIEILKAGS